MPFSSGPPSPALGCRFHWCLSYSCYYIDDKTGSATGLDQSGHRAFKPQMTGSSVSTAPPHPTSRVTRPHPALPHCRSFDPAAPVDPGEVVETADGVCKFPGQRLSWWQARESCEQHFGHLALAPPAEVLAPRLPDPIWVGQREAPLRRPPQRRECGPRG